MIVTTGKHIRIEAISSTIVLERTAETPGCVKVIHRRDGTSISLPANRQESEEFIAAYRRAISEDIEYRKSECEFAKNAPDELEEFEELYKELLGLIEEAKDVPEMRPALDRVLDEARHVAAHEFPLTRLRERMQQAERERNELRIKTEDLGLALQRMQQAERERDVLRERVARLVLSAGTKEESGPGEPSPITGPFK